VTRKRAKSGAYRGWKRWGRNGASSSTRLPGPGGKKTSGKGTKVTQEALQTLIKKKISGGGKRVSIRLATPAGGKEFDDEAKKGPHKDERAV